jgi:hypothetical protein
MIGRELGRLEPHDFKGTEGALKKAGPFQIRVKYCQGVLG